MPASVEQHANEPIVFLTFTDDVKAEALVHAYMDSVEIAGKLGKSVYRVIDFRSAESSYVSIFTNLLALVQGVAGAAVAPTLEAVFVGQPHMAEFFVRQQVAFFEDIDGAVTYVHSRYTEAALDV
jgi:hypothetical protein